MNVGVIFGGESVEHDVSILTALQAMEALAARHVPVPIYISRQGRWYTGQRLQSLETYTNADERSGEEISCDLSGGVLRPVMHRSKFFKSRRTSSRRVDVVVPTVHGTSGEDGALQGLLEFSGVPYAGSSVAASAIAMDKSCTKAVLQRASIAVVESVEVRRSQWRDNRMQSLEDALRIPLPVYVKPARLGSSIGVRRCADESAVEEALELALELDKLAVIERSMDRAIEINCSVLGSADGLTRTSALEQPLRQDEFLSFDDKYMRGAKAEGMKGAERIIPAPVSADTATRIAAVADAAFRALGCSGVARVDFLVDDDETIYVNELNTIPGSFAFYLWDPIGLSFVDLLDELIKLARREFAEGKELTRTFPSSLLSARVARGSKATQ
jgi:D-alanine-D-alanine ligase